MPKPAAVHSKFSLGGTGWQFLQQVYYESHCLSRNWSSDRYAISPFLTFEWAFFCLASLLGHCIDYDTQSNQTWRWQRYAYLHTDFYTFFNHRLIAVLLLDLMAVHMIRKSSATGSSTIITYHPEPAWGRTTAKGMHSRVKLAGESVYWSKIFDKTSDPTFVLLTILWHALYLWDQALSTLYAHICWLVSVYGFLLRSLFSLQNQSKTFH